MGIEMLIYALLGLPLIASALVLVLHDRPNLRDGQALFIGLITAGCAIQLYAAPHSETVTLFSLAAGLDVKIGRAHV